MEILLAPNGKPSNLTPEQYKLVRTPEFVAWFGNWMDNPNNASKVVDENGEPLVVWHGTDVKNKFYEFKIAEGSNKKSKMQLLFGSHFASNLEDAKIYSKPNGNVYEVFLNIRNILDLEKHYEMNNPKFNDVFEIIKELKLDKKYKNALDYELFTENGDYGGKSNDVQRLFLTQHMLDSLPPKKVFDTLRSKFDGIQYVPYQPQGFNGYSNFSKSYIAFEPNQIKLADGTNITFDSNNPDIRYAGGGGVPSLLAPNGKPSNLNTEQYKFVRSESFKAFFGDWEKLALTKINDSGIDDISLKRLEDGVSKIVDENGEPLVCFHGTFNDEFTIFRNSDIGAHFGTYEQAKRRVNSDKAFIKPFFLNIKNPLFLLDFDKGKWDGVAVGLMLRDSNIVPMYIRIEIEDVLEINEAKNGLSASKRQDNRMRELLESINYDGIIYNNKFEGEGRSFITFKPNQIKIANGKNTTFDLNNPDFTLAEGGGIKATTERFRPTETVNFNPPLVGTNGNKLVSYTWKYDYVVDVKEGEDISKRVSDWTQAETNAETGRDIVHVFDVLDTNGKLSSVSSESVPVALGFITNDQKKSFINLATSAKTLAKQQLQLSILKAKNEEIKKVRQEIIDAGYPEITYPESSWNNIDEDNLYMKMGDGSVVGYKSNPNNPERLTALKDSYIRSEMNKRGFSKSKYDTYDLEQRIIRQEKKVQRLAELKPELFKGGGDIKEVLLAPNGKPSNLSKEQYELVRSKSFISWFGDWLNDPENASKVVDENGEPLVVYRGNLINQEELGYVFNLGKNFLRKENDNQFGFFFTNELGVAKKYMLVNHFDEIEGGSITSVFIKTNKILNLLDFGLKIGQDNFIDSLIEKGVHFDNEYNYLETKIRDFDADSYKGWGYNVFDYFDVFPDLRNLFIKNGFYCVVFYEMSRMYNKYKVYVAFEPNQIKLADGTNTTFDPNNEDIRFAEGGGVDILGEGIEFYERTYADGTKKRFSIEEYAGGGYLTFKEQYNKKFGYDIDKSHNLEQISRDTRVSLKGLQQIYNKGIGAFKTNPRSVRPTVKSKEQWAMARVYSAVMGGKASKIDSNELKMKKGGGIPDNYIHVVNNFGNGETLNKVFNEWSNIQSEKDQANWSMRVKLLRFGTYQQFTLLDVMEKFDFDKSDKINGILKRDFKKEVESAYENEIITINKNNEMKKENETFGGGGGVNDNFPIVKLKIYANNPSYNKRYFESEALFDFSNEKIKFINIDTFGDDYRFNWIKVKENSKGFYIDFEYYGGRIYIENYINLFDQEKNKKKLAGGGGVAAKSSHTLNSNKGKIAINLDSKWNDIEIMLVPISFIAKCSEFNRRNNPKYSLEDSAKNIENIKKSFIENGITEPLILNYIRNESKLLLTEGNHRLNALIELEVPYYPVCVTVIDSWTRGKGKGVKTKVKPYMITEINKSKYLSVDNFEGVPYVNIENNHVDVNETDTLTINVPLLIRLFEYIREDVDNDAQIHFLTENLLKLKDKELSMSDYNSIIDGIKIKKTAEKILALGGLAEGPAHSEGGIPLVVKSTGQNIEIEGGELVVNKFSSSETEKFKFEGKDLTPCEIVSELNSMDNNGVEIDCNKILGRFKK